MIRWKASGLRIPVALLAVVAGVGLLFGEASKPSPNAPKPNRYIGASKCKNCHEKEDAGSQHGVWSKARHAQAFATLSGDKAKEIAAAKGIEDPATAEQCVKCHVTAFGVDPKEIKKGFKVEEGVQCESCHGPGEAHMKARFMAAATADESAPVVYGQLPDGEIISSPAVDTCVACHNDESPTFQSFCFHEAKAKVRHLNPLKPRTDEEKAALEACACEGDCVCKSGGCK